MRALFLLLFIGASAFAEPTAQDFYDFLIRSEPSGALAPEFFQRMAEDPALRARVSATLREHPEFRRLAQEGLAFRTQYENYLNRSFNGDPGLRAWAESPNRALHRAWVTFLETQRESAEKNIPEPRANQLALQNTIRYFSLPLSTNESDLRRDSNHWDFFRRELNRRKSDTEIKSLPPTELDAQKVQLWKNNMLNRIRELRTLAVKEGLRELTKNGKALALYPSQFDSSVANLFTRGRVNLRGEELEGATLRILKKSDVPNGVSRDEFAPPSTHLRDFGRLLTMIPLAPNEILKNKIDPTRTREAAQLTYPPGLGEPEDLIEISWTPKPPAKDLTPRKFLLPLGELFDQLSLPETGAVEKMRGNTDWVGKNPAHAYLATLSARDGQLRQIEVFLRGGKGEKSPQLVNRLKQRPKDQQIFGVLGPYLNPGAFAHDDLIAGLEWSGYAKHPEHWLMRDKAAPQGVAFSPGLGLSHRQSGVAWKQRWDLLRRMNPYLRAATIWSAGIISVAGVAGAGYGAYLVAKNLPRIYDFTMGGGGSESGTGLQIQDTPKAYNKPLDTWGSGTRLYHLAPGNPFERGSFPEFFDFIGKDTTGLRYGMSEDVKLEEGKMSSFTIESLVPHYKGELNEVLLPTVDHHQLSSIELFDAHGNTLIRGNDFEIRQDAVTKLFFIQLTSDWPKDSTFRFTLGYRPGPGMDNATTDAFQNLDKGRLASMVVELQTAGFRALAYNLDTLIKEARKNNAPVSLQTLAEIFSKSGVYDSTPEGKPLAPEKYLNDYSAFAHFLREDGRMHAQCDGGNQLLALFLERYFANNPDISVVSQSCFVRRSPEDITAGDGHLRTLVATRDGKHRWIIDGTPEEPKNPDGPAFRKGEVIPIDLYSERRRTFRDLMGEKKEPGKKKKKPKGGVPPTEPGPEPDVHEIRRGKFLKLRENLLANALVKQLPAHIRAGAVDPSPTTRALQLGHALVAYGGGEIPFEGLKDTMRDTFPGALEGIKLDGPADLKAALWAIAHHQRERMARLAAKVESGEMKRYAALANADLLEPVWALHDLYGNTDWSPVPPKKKPSSESPCRVVTGVAGHS